MKLPKILQILSSKLSKNSAKAIVVGGSVRDHFLELPIKDYDIEVYGLDTIEELEAILKQYGSVNLVGKSFGVLKFVYKGEEYDFSFPRLEQKVSDGHRGFNITCNGTLSYEEASLRRDFTINAMGYDIEEKVFLDPYEAKADIKSKTLRHINLKTFKEDPLRVYRAVQFCARFSYTLADETFQLCYEMVEEGALEFLAKERVYMEFKKLLLKSPQPSVGFELMRKLGILKYYPELEAIIGVPQPPKWHPEGDVWVHTLMSVDKMVMFKTADEKYNLKMMFAILCHDLGKATHTQITPQKISAIGHEKAGLEPTKSFLYRLTDEHNFINSILPLVEYHLLPSIYYRGKAKSSTIRRLSTKVNIEELVTVARADFLGRTTKESLSGFYKAGDWILEKAKELDVSNEPPKPLVQGRDLIALGIEPSKKYKILLDSVYNEQIQGNIVNKKDAILYLMELLKSL
jgi:tRNA nucleotidyltransferase (CCA-adding enzyme)